MAVHLLSNCSGANNTHPNLAIAQFNPLNMKTEHEECRKTAKRIKRGSLQEECDALKNQKRSNSKTRRRQKLKPPATK